MPTIPQSTGPSVRRAPLPTPLANPNMASPDAFGASVAQGLQRGADIAYDANRRAEEREQQAEEERARALAKAQAERDDIDVLDADNHLVDASNDIKAKALQVQGDNVMAKNGQPSLSDRTRAEFETLVAERLKGLSTPRAKQMFAQRAAQRWNSLDTSVVEHSENEITKHKEATLQGAIDREGIEAIDSMDPARIADASAKRFVARQALSNMKGVDLEVEHAKDDSSLYAAATERYITAKDWRGAAAFYEANKGKILTPVRDKLQGAIKEGAVQGLAETATAAIVMPRDGAKPTMTQAVSAANKIQDPEVRKRTVESVRAMYVLDEQANERDQEDTYKALYKELRANGGHLNALPPLLVSSMDPKWRKTLESDAKEVIGESTPTKKTYENIAAADGIRTAIDRGYLDGKDGARLPVTDAVVRQLAAEYALTAEQAESVSNYKKQGGTKGALTITQVEKTYEYVTGGRKYDDDRKRYPNLFDQVKERLVPGQEITAENLNAAMAPILAEGQVDGSGWLSDSMTYGQASTQGKADQWMPRVEATEEKAISAHLRKNAVSNITPVVVQRFKKYEMLGYPTPMRDGKPMTAREAVLAGTLQGNPRDLSASVRESLPRTAAEKESDAYNDPGDESY